MGNKEFDEIVDFAANRNNYIKITDLPTIQIGTQVFINNQEYIPIEEVKKEIAQLQIENNRLLYEVEDYQDCISMTAGENKELKKQVEYFKLAASLGILQYMNKKVETDEFVSRETLLAAEEENQKLIEQNWKLEKTLMDKLGFHLNHNEEYWWKHAYGSVTGFPLIYNIPVGKVNELLID